MTGFKNLSIARKLAMAFVVVIALASLLGGYAMVQLRARNTQIVEINRMKRREDAKAYKTFEVNVEPGATLRVGVRLLRDKLDTDSINANAYWEPVVWETVPGKCP